MRSWRLCCRVLSALGILVAGFLSSESVVAEEASELRVMSFNIRYGAAKDGDNAWPHRKELVVKTIQEFNPDLLGTQETLPFQAEYLLSELPEYSRIGWTRETNPKGEQCAIFYRNDRFDLTHSGQFWLSETPDKKYTKSWDSSLPRVATWVVLSDKQDADKQFVFVNTHFDHRGATARHESAKLVHHRASELGGMPIILTGDFNCQEGSEPWKALTSSGLLKDTRRVVHPEPEDNEGTFNGFRGPARKGRIDWILATKDFDVHSADIVRTQDQGRYPSDHFPVTAVLRRL